MALNWTIESTIYFISFLLNAIAFMATSFVFMRKRHRHAAFITSIYFGLTVWSVSIFLGYLLLDVTGIRLGLYIGLVTIGLVFFMIDSFTRDETDSRKSIVLSIAATLLVIFSLQPEEITLGWNSIGEPSLNLGMGVMTTGAFLIILTGSAFTYYMVRMNNEVPRNLKTGARLGLLSGIILAGVWPLGLGLGLHFMYPGLWLLLLSIGVIPIGIAFVRYPKLAYVLPFKVLRLVVFETDGGVPLFSYSWSGGEEIAQEALFSGMLQGIAMILDESVRKGAVREIVLENGVLVLQRTYKYSVACVLVTTKSSRTLRNALDSFAETFYNEFSDQFDDVSEVRKFSSATSLVDEHFGFVPTI